MIVKRTIIPDGCAVAPYSFVNKPFEEKMALLAGIPAKIIKHAIHWDTLTYKQACEKYFGKTPETRTAVERERERE